MYYYKPTDPDTPLLHKAVYIPYIEGFIDDMDDDINALQKSQIYSIFTQWFVKKWKRVVKSTLEFKIKRFPDGTMINIMTGFLAGGIPKYLGLIYLIPMHMWFNGQLFGWLFSSHKY